MDILSDVLGWPRVDLEITRPSRDFVTRFPARLLLEHNLLPLSQDEQVVNIATARPIAPIEASSPATLTQVNTLFFAAAGVALAALLA